MGGRLTSTVLVGQAGRRQAGLLTPCTLPTQRRPQRAHSKPPTAQHLARSLPGSWCSTMAKGMVIEHTTVHSPLVPSLASPQRGAAEAVAEGAAQGLSGAVPGSMLRQDQQGSSGYRQQRRQVGTGGSMHTAVTAAAYTGYLAAKESHKLHAASLKLRASSLRQRRTSSSSFWQAAQRSMLLAGSSAGTPSARYGCTSR